jgi:molybdopterin-guanine dinucleotide biosynthesis protein A
MYHLHMEGTPLSVAVFILAGGKSARMGADKAFVMLDGQTLLARALELARSLTSDVRIVGDAAKFHEFAPAVEDIFRDCGPLGGIHAALRASQAELNLMLAVDVPFVSPEFLQFLMARARESKAIVTFARVQERRQPLCAVYRREFADIAEMALRAGRYKIDALFETETMQMIGEKDLLAGGFSVEMFRNVNTPEELAEVRNKFIKTADTQLAKS